MAAAEAVVELAVQVGDGGRVLAHHFFLRCVAEPFPVHGVPHALLDVFGQDFGTGRSRCLLRPRRGRTPLSLSQSHFVPELFHKAGVVHEAIVILLAPEHDLVDNGVAKGQAQASDDLLKLLSEKYSIKAIVQFYPLNRYPLFIKMGFADADCPNADFFFDNMVSFPFHHWMKEDDFKYMISCTKLALDELRL